MCVIFEVFFSFLFVGGAFEKSTLKKLENPLLDSWFQELKISKKMWT